MEAGKEIKFDTSETFEINTENKIYALKISNNEELLYFEIKEKNSFVKEEYNLYTNFKELVKINRFFNQFDNLKKVFEFFKKQIIKKMYQLFKKKKR